MARVHNSIRDADLATLSEHSATIWLQVQFSAGGAGLRSSPVFRHKGFIFIDETKGEDGWKLLFRFSASILGVSSSSASTGSVESPD